jgi:chromosomal replication initiator protein dnaA
LLTRQQLSGQEISHQDVLDTLTTLGFAVDPSTPNVENLLKQNKKSTKNFDTLVEIVAEYYNIAIADLKSDSRKKEITTARQLLMYIAKQHFNWTLEKIGDYFGGKDHATAIYAIKNITKKLKLDAQIQHDYRVFEDRIS